MVPCLLAMRESGCRFADLAVDAESPTGAGRLYERLGIMAAQRQFFIPIEKVYPMEQVQDAYRDAATRHGRGKRILAISPADLRR